MSLNWQAGAQAAGNFLGSLVQSLPPLLTTLATTAETLVPNAKSGAQKLNYVTTTASLWLQNVGVTAMAATALMPILEQTVNALIAAAKAVPAALQQPPQDAPTPPAT